MIWGTAELCWGKYLKPPINWGCAFLGMDKFAMCQLCLSVKPTTMMTMMMMIVMSVTWFSCGSQIKIRYLHPVKYQQTILHITQTKILKYERPGRGLGGGEREGGGRVRQTANKHIKQHCLTADLTAVLRRVSQLYLARVSGAETSHNPAPSPG